MHKSTWILGLVLVLLSQVLAQEGSALTNTPDILYFPLPYDSLLLASKDLPVRSDVSYVIELSF